MADGNRSHRRRRLASQISPKPTPSSEQQLQSKDRVLLQMNTELYEMRKKVSGGLASTRSAEDVIKTLTANEEEIKRLQTEIMQLNEDNKRIMLLELRLSSGVG